MKLSDLYPGKPHLRQVLVERFWPKVDVRGEDECWPWLASIAPRSCSNGNHSPGGYGRFGIGTHPYSGNSNAYMGAHRVSYMLEHGEVPENSFVCHSCDFPGCCNPRHLWLGDIHSNNADRIAKNRTRGGSSPGETSPNAVFTAQQVIDIRHRIKDGDTVNNLSAEMGVSQGAVYYAAVGRTYSNVTGESPLDSVPRPLISHCKWGHPFTKNNTRFVRGKLRKDGTQMWKRRCITCSRRDQRQKYLRLKAKTSSGSSVEAI